MKKYLLTGLALLALVASSACRDEDVQACSDLTGMSLNDCLTAGGGDGTNGLHEDFPDWEP